MSVVDYGEDANGPFLVMQLVEGVSFSRLIKDLGETGHLLEMQVACELVRQTALGLAAAHDLRGLDGTALGVVHRDVSPFEHPRWLRWRRPGHGFRDRAGGRS